MSSSPDEYSNATSRLELSSSALQVSRGRQRFKFFTPVNAFSTRYASRRPTPATLSALRNGALPMLPLTLRGSCFTSGTTGGTPGTAVASSGAVSAAALGGAASTSPGVGAGTTWASGGSASDCGCNCNGGCGQSWVSTANSAASPTTPNNVPSSRAADGLSGAVGCAGR